METNKMSKEESNSVIGQEDEYRHNFWTKIQDGCHLWVPKHIKNILKYSNLDNPVCLQDLTETNIKELESFVKKRYYKKFKNEANLEEYFGLFCDEPENFEFDMGDKILLNRLVMFVASKPASFWTLSATNVMVSTEQMPTVQSRDKFEPNIDAELSKVKNQVAGIISQSSQYFSEEDRLKITNGMKIDLAVEKDDYENPRKYKATITCSICDGNLNFKKDFGDKTRWVISNLNRHFWTHYVTQPDSTKMKRQIRKRKSVIFLPQEEVEVLENEDPESTQIKTEFDNLSYSSAEAW